jgi:GTPase Era involved in 16S rRNA processing
MFQHCRGRLKKTQKIFDRADTILLVTEPGQWTPYESAVLDEAAQRKIPVLIVVNKTDLGLLPRPSWKCFSRKPAASSRSPVLTPWDARRRSNFSSAT